MAIKYIMCECSDPGCPVTHGQGCRANAAGKRGVILYRIDMEDVTGTLFCWSCANDATDSGVFTDVEEV